MVIGSFPDFYPDEIFYSAMSRFAVSMHYPNLRDVIEEVFGSQQLIATLYFPSHQDALVTRLPPNSVYTADSLINQHTLLPFFAPFLPPDRLGKLKENMRGAGGPAGHMRAGTMASIVPLTAVLRYCPECVREDRAQLGECYWHRLHQVPGVLVCPDHDVWLESSEVAVRHQVRRMAYISAEEALISLPTARQVPTTSVGEILHFLAESAVWLLQQVDLSPGLEVLQQRYQHALIKHGLATYHGRVKMADLLEAFCATYRPALLSLLGCQLDAESSDHWLARLVRKPHGALHPVQHLLLIRLLGYTVEEFFQLTAKKTIWGWALALLKRCQRSLSATDDFHV